jgi:ribosomal protein S18 acetylase RimI-like enzyme
MENVIREHGIDAIELWVETNNDRAKELYERLGFAVTNKLPHQWEQDMPDGSVELYKTTVYEMRKAL